MMLLPEKTDVDTSVCILPHFQCMPARNAHFLQKLKYTTHSAVEFILIF